MSRETASGAVLRHLHELNNALADVPDLMTEVIASGAGRPYLRVSNRHAPTLAEAISLEPFPPDDRLWFIWSWGQATCPAAEIGRARAEVVRVLLGVAEAAQQ